MRPKCKDVLFFGYFSDFHIAAPGAAVNGNVKLYVIALSFHTSKTIGILFCVYLATELSHIQVIQFVV